MKQLQRKCLIASAVTHGLLLVMLLVGSAFVPARRPPEEAVSIQLVDIPDLLVDEPNMVGGGNPKAGIPDPAPAVLMQQPVVPAPQPLPMPPDPAPAQPQAAPAQPEKAEEEKPVLPKPEPNPFNFAEAKTVKAAPPKPAAPVATFDFGKAERKTIKPAGTTSRTSPANSRSAEASAAAAREAQIASVMGAARARMQQGLSTGVGEIGIPGPGGAAYASYGVAIKKIYYDAWIAPMAAGDNEPTVEVEVVIARDGTVLSKRITKRSGKRELDRTVQEAIDRVKKTREFPSGSTDEKRTFKIHFNLNSKNSIG